MEKAGTGSRQVPGRRYSLSQRRTVRPPGGVPEVAPCAPALCLGHQGKPLVLRQGTPQRCVRHIWFLYRKVLLHKGRHCAWRVPKSAGEGHGREASSGAGGHLERAPAPLPGLKGRLGANPWAPFGGKETVTEWSAPTSRAAITRVRFEPRTKACRGPVHLGGTPRRSSCGL